MHRVALGLVVVLASLISVGCAYHNPAQPAPPAIDLTTPSSLMLNATASGQTAAVSATVLNVNHRPLAGVDVTFGTDSGSVAPITALSDSHGIAATSLTSQPGSVTLMARVGSLQTSTLVQIQTPMPVPPPNQPGPGPIPMEARLVLNNAKAGTEAILVVVVDRPNGFPITYTWRFGDAVSQITYFPVVTHVYTAAGLYDVTVDVRDASGQQVRAAAAQGINP